MAQGFVITVPSIDALDTAWQILREQDHITEAELHVAGRGLVWKASRCASGRWTASSAPSAVPQGSGSHQAPLAVG